MGILGLCNRILIVTFPLYVYLYPIGSVSLENSNITNTHKEIRKREWHFEFSLGSVPTASKTYTLWLFNRDLPAERGEGGSNDLQKEKGKSCDRQQETFTNLLLFFFFFFFFLLSSNLHYSLLDHC